MIREPGGTPASALWLPLECSAILGRSEWPAVAACHGSGVAWAAGGGAISSCLVAEAGRAGGSLGGGGTREAPLDEALDTRTSVLPGLASVCEYSQHGRTLCPEGAVSSW